MQMLDALATFCPRIRDDTEAFLVYTEFTGQLRHDIGKDMRYHRFILICKGQHTFHMLLRNDQHMDRSLRLKVFECYNLLILIDKERLL